MPRRITPSQARADLRRAQSRQRAAVQNFNRKVREHNNKVRRYNSERRRAIDAYNREVRAYNTRLRANQSRLRSALQRLSALSVPGRYSSLRDSTQSLYGAYEHLDSGSADAFLTDLAEREAANSIRVVNRLAEDEGDDETVDNGIGETGLVDQLARFSTDLGDRWSGALFSLNPRNREATRHFCSSAREIMSDILDIVAPDDDVLAWFSNAPLTDEGSPARRAKIGYCLTRSGRYDDALASFADANIDDILVLFRDLNIGTHGPSGSFSESQLVAIRLRVEGAINFVIEIARP